MCCAPRLHYGIERRIYAICMATSREYDNVFVIVWRQEILPELQPFDGDGTLLLSIPLDYWTISPAGSEVESHWLF